MTAFIYRSATAGQTRAGMANGSSIANEGSGKIYETVTRLACGGMHLINPSTGKVLGAEAALTARR
jgi:hypothetical protein